MVLLNNFISIFIFIFSTLTLGMYSDLSDNELKIIPTTQIVENLEKLLSGRKDVAQAHWELARALALAATKKEIQRGSGSNEIPEINPKDSLIQGGAVHLKKAIEHYNEAIKRDSDNKQYLLGRGWCYKLLNQKDAALKDLRRVFNESIILHNNLYKIGALSNKNDKGTSNSQRINALTEARFLYTKIYESSNYLKEILDKKNNEKELADINDKVNKAGLLSNASSDDQMDIPGSESPIIIPLNANETSIENLIAKDKFVLFNLDGTGKKHWQWVQPNTGFLIYLDKEQSSLVNSGRQLFGNITFWIFWKSGYDALRSLDNNQDGFLNGDELYRVAIWQDKNQDGNSTSEEILSLDSLNIVRISCYSELHNSGIEYNPTGIIYKNKSTRPSYDWISIEKNEH